MEQKPELDNQQPKIENHPQDSSSQNTDNGNFWEKEVSRRQFLIAGGAIVGTAGLVVAARGTANLISSSDQKTQQPENPNQVVEKEVFGPGIEYGFNTHVHVNPAEGDNMTLDAFKGTVDTLVQANQSWIRFNLINTGAVTQNKDGSLNFSEGIEVFDQAIDYAKEKGLKIAFVTNAPESLKSAQIDDYVEKSAAFYTQLALRYGDKIDTWQIFNEANTHHFRDYNDKFEFGQEYLDDLTKVISASAEAIKAISKNAKITMNAAMVYGVNNHQDVLNSTTQFFDSLAEHLDFISIDPYPSIEDQNSFQFIPKDIEFLFKEYKKDVVVAEIGAPSRVTDHLGLNKADVLLAQISAIESGNVKPKAIMIYEHRDENAIGNGNNEGTFGVEDEMNQLIPHMQPEQSEADQ